MLTVQRVAQSILLGMLTFAVFGVAGISAIAGNTNRAAGFLLFGALLCFFQAWLKGKWLKEEQQAKART